MQPPSECLRNGASDGFVAVSAATSASGFDFQCSAAAAAIKWTTFGGWARPRQKTDRQIDGSQHCSVPLPLNAGGAYRSRYLSVYCKHAGAAWAADCSRWSWNDGDTETTAAAAPASDVVVAGIMLLTGAARSYVTARLAGRSASTDRPTDRRRRRRRRGGMRWRAQHTRSLTPG